MYNLKKIIKSSIFWFVSIEIILAIILYNKGFRITYSPKLETCWDAVGAIGQWAGALVGLLIPIYAVYLQSSLDNNKRDIGESNSELYNEFIKFKSEYTERINALSKLVDKDINDKNLNENSQENLKEKALKFINITMVTSTKNVAEHLKIDEDKAFDLLVEMLRSDESISCGGQVLKENKNNIVWLKKSKR